MNNQGNAEEQFKNFCEERKWKIYKIPELPDIQTPDFFVVADNQVFICEVKNLSKSGAERKDIAEFKDKKGNIVGIHLDYNKEIDSIINKIDNAMFQFRTTSSFGMPNVLVICSDRFRPLDKDIILRAMYGKVFQRLRIKTPGNVSRNASTSLPPLIVDRTLRRDKNNLISAVAIPNKQNGMSVLHNLWANFPLSISVFNKRDDVNYIPEQISFKEI